MKIFNHTGWTLTRSRSVAPTFVGAQGGVCPQAGFRRVDADGSHRVVTLMTDAAGTGRRPWSPLIT